VQPRKPILQSVVTFFIHPKLESVGDVKKISKNIYEKLFDFIRIFTLQYMCTIFAGLLLFSVMQKLDYQSTDHAITDFILENSIFEILLFSSVIAPIIEELTFRAYLKPTRVNFAVSLSLIAIIAVKVLLPIPEWLFTSTEFSGLLSYVVAIPVLTGCIAYLLKFLPYRKKLLALYHRYYIFVFYMSALLFGLVHITNFNNFKESWYLIPLFVLPQIFVGLFLGYIRAKLGLLWAFLGHMLHNYVSISPMILFMFAIENFPEIFEATAVGGQMPEIIFAPYGGMLIGVAVFQLLLCILLFLILSIQMLLEQLIYQLRRMESC